MIDVPFNRTYKKLVQQRLNKGMPKSEARQDTRRLIQKFELMKKHKRELGFTSSEALTTVKRTEQERLVQRELKRLNPKYQISRAQAQDLLWIFNNPHFVPVIHAIRNHQQSNQSPYSFGDFLADYAQLRFQIGKAHPKTATGFKKFLFEMIRNRLGILPKKFETAISDIVYIHGVRPEIPCATEVDFFERVLREKTEHSILSQQRALELELIARIRFGLPEERFLVKLGRWVGELKQPTPPELLTSVRRRVHDFDQKPSAIQERIIEEARASQLGEKISACLQEFLEKDIQQSTKGAAFGMLLYGKPGWFKEKIEYAQWMLGNLKRPGNRKFLAQKAIEWFGKQQ